MKRITCAVAVLAAAGSALGQCSIAREDVPDIDQRRTGLPANGGMYCVPTSAINWMAYISNRGYPQMMGVSGWSDWQSNVNINVATARIMEMGLFMSTDPEDGTTSSSARTGAAVYTGVRGLPFFTITSTTGEISPVGVYLHMLNGGLVNICYGFYVPTGQPNTYTRDGGHCVTVTAVYDACGSAPRLRYNNPWTDSSLTTQSTAATESSRLVRQTFASDFFSTPTRWRLIDTDTNARRRYIDSRLVIRPLIALTSSAHRAGEVVTLRPVNLDGFDLPAQTAAAVPDGGAITDLALMPDGLEAIVASHAPGQLRRVWRYMIPTGEFTQAMICESALSGAATSRFGDVYVYCDGAVWRLELLEGGDTSTHEEAPAPHPIDALAYDDARDELVGVSSAGMRLVRHTRTLATIVDSALPAVQLSGDISLAIDEANQRYLIAGSGGPTIYELGVVPGSPDVQLVGEIALPAVQHPTGLQFNDQGNLVVIHDGGIAEFARTAEGGWAPADGSVLAGLEAHGVLAVARSRTDFIPGLHDTPEWRNVPDEPGEERPACRADWDVNGVVNSQDISAFLTSWLGSVQASTAAADFNHDGAVNSTDISAFLTAWLEDVTVGCW